jgi:hypothetical protein
VNIAAAHQAFDGRVPTFLLRGAMMVSSNSECRGYVAVFNGEHDIAVSVNGHDLADAHVGNDISQEPHEAHSFLAGPCAPAEPETPVPEPPCPARIAALKADIERLNARLEEAKDGKGKSALAMTIALRKLAERHQIRSLDRRPLALLDPIDAPAIRFKGIAATDHVDDARMSFHRDCWPELRAADLKLCLNHDLSKIVGTLEAVEVRAGAVWVTGMITDKTAMRMPALSISATVDRFTIRNPDSPTLFAGEITKVSSCNEATLTDHPQNIFCKVTERWPVTAVDLSYAELIDRVKAVREMVAGMRFGKAA